MRLRHGELLQNTEAGLWDTPVGPPVRPLEESEVGEGLLLADKANLMHFADISEGDINDSDDDADEAPETLDGELWADERERAHQCLCHDLNLCVLDLIRDTGLMTLVYDVDKVNAAVRHSTLRLQQLAELQQLLHIKRCRLVPRSTTRWNTLLQSLETYLQARDALIVMEHRGCFVDSKLEVNILSDGDARRLEALCVPLRSIEIVSRILENQKLLTLPHVPYLVHHLLETERWRRRDGGSLCATLQRGARCVCESASL